MSDQERERRMRWLRIQYRLCRWGATLWILTFGLPLALASLLIAFGEWLRDGESRIVKLWLAPATLCDEKCQKIAEEYASLQTRSRIFSKAEREVGEKADG